MKKVLFALAAVVALAACSQEDVIVADKGTAIGFDTFVENSTRINDPSLHNGNLANFGVFGTVSKTGTALIFDNVEVTGGGVGADANWSYASQYTQYWIAGATYNFAALAPYNADYDVQFSTTNFKTTLNFTNNGTTDLLYAQSGEITGLDGAAPGATTPANGKVAFTFRHILSKIKFSFENQYLSTGSTIRVYDVVLDNAHSTGTATLDATSTVWSVGNDDLSIDFGDTENTTNDPTATSIKQGTEWESENARFIIPGTKKIYSVRFKVDVLYGNTVVETYNHVATLEFTPDAGVAYDIKSTITHLNIDPSHAQEPIQFTVTEVDEWDDYQPKDAIIN